MSGPGPLRPARPTLRCLREDLCLAVPPVTAPLDEIDHPVLTKASEQFADEDGKHERIRSVDDQVLFKVKVQRGAARYGWTPTCRGWSRRAGARMARAMTSMQPLRLMAAPPGLATTRNIPTA
ncbi:hypothetical protein [Streptomyces sp. NPDC017086]|uniref:hypothetical protein n=1 Tax=Streptomyces sp. NPDC017086 TaxID=3364976 RepID=UPI0037A1EC44